MAAITRGKSLMPLSIWKAAPSTSNGNEQAHCNINRDGVKLSIVAGIMAGHKHNAWAMASLDLSEALGINTNDQVATHFRCALRSIHRSGMLL